MSKSKKIAPLMRNTEIFRMVMLLYTWGNWETR